MKNLKKHKRASGIYRLEPLFFDENKKTVMIDGKTYYVDGKLGEFQVVSVPETTTMASARNIEKSLSEALKKPVLVITHNMTFLKATLLSTKEKLKLLGTVEKQQNELSMEEKNDIVTQ